MQHLLNQKFLFSVCVLFPHRLCRRCTILKKIKLLLFDLQSWVSPFCSLTRGASILKITPDTSAEKAFSALVSGVIFRMEAPRVKLQNGETHDCKSKSRSFIFLRIVQRRQSRCGKRTQTLNKNFWFKRCCIIWRNWKYVTGIQL